MKTHTMPAATGTHDHENGEAIFILRVRTPVHVRFNKAESRSSPPDHQDEDNGKQENQHDTPEHYGNDQRATPRFLCR